MFWRFKSILETTINNYDMRVVKWYLLWNVICIIRGLFVAETYWDWKGFTSASLGILVPIVAFSASCLPLWQSIIKFFLKFGLPLFLLLSFAISKDAYGFFLVPVTFLLFFLPVIPFKGKIIITFFAIWVMFADVTARSNVIKFGVPFVLLLVYWTRNIVPVKILEVCRIVLIVTPIILFSLAVTDTFNVFKINEYVSGDYTKSKVNADGEVVDESLTTDTRTFLYEEVLGTAKKYNTWIIGRSPARGNETVWFADLAEITGRKERLWNEAAILNVFMWTGIVGVALYLLVFNRASYMAINHSNNIYSKMLGLFMAFRWGYAWVEDGNFFNITTVFLWFMLGICLTTSFRSMTDEEVKNWIGEIFGKRNIKEELEELEMQLNA
ncbi:O-antigen ligase family protein [Mucilaginibacter robiniae]|nr:O-antigen ligase family protein [Mucilaginibacter robiniae]